MNKWRVMGVLLLAAAGGCATSSEEQRRALVHQSNSDQAAGQGEFGVAGDEQRKAENAHHKAVDKAIDEGRPIPPQTQTGDVPPPPPPPQ